MMKKIFLTMSVCLLMAACQNDDAPQPPAMKARVDIPLSPAEKLMVKESNQFALDLFRQITGDMPDKNVSISPFSASLCLSMVANGAKGTTADEMYQVLGYKGFTQEEMNAFNKKMCESLLEVDPTTQLNIANAIWADNGFPVKSGFVEVNRNNYKAEVGNLDFSSPSALRTINDWCAGHTNNLIKEILTELNPAARLVLANALYFKGTWASKFDKGQTKGQTFTAADGSQARVDMMNQSESFPYAEIENAEMVELSYGNEAFSMVIILPKDVKSMSELIHSQLTPESWNESLNSMQETSMELSLPRFRVEFERELNLDLISMGMGAAFDENADFSGISDKSLRIGFVKQKTFIEVNEEGTEAAVVTASGMIGSAGPSISFVVNKPFIYLIKEKSTGAILFMGRINKLK